MPGIVLAGLVVDDPAGEDDAFIAFRLRGQDITPDLRIDRGGRGLGDGLDVDQHSGLQVAREGAVCLELSQVQFGGVTTSLQILGDLVVQLSFLILEVAGPAFDVGIDESAVILRGLHHAVHLGIAGVDAQEVVGGRHLVCLDESDTFVNESGVFGHHFLDGRAKPDFFAEGRVAGQDEQEADQGDQDDFAFSGTHCVSPFSGAVENTNLDMISQGAGFVNTIGVLAHSASIAASVAASFFGHFEVFLPKDENYKQFDRKSEVEVPQIRTNTG